ncbi:MAG TPA: hypothetical protein VHE83_01850 [Mycobacteriales bacterium]|nr:hypothetical protein [Mycobacteriales bacterium]
MTAAVLEHRFALRVPRPAITIPVLRAAVLWPCVGFTVGCVALAFDYAGPGYAAEGTLKYALFWVGLLAAFVPIGARLASSSTSRALRMTLIVLLAVVTYAPKVLRSPAEPGFIDELLHLSQVQRMAAAGHPVANSVVPVIGHYPGLDLATIGLHVVTRLSLWCCALLVVGLAHLALLLAVHRLALAVSGDDRLAGVSVLLYASGPGFLFFTTQFAYESLGIATAAWAVVAVVEATRAGARHRGWTTAAVALIAATVVTHHVSSIFMTVALIALAVAQRVHTGRSMWTRRSIGLAAFAGATTAAWMSLSGWAVVDYVLPTGDELRGLLHGQHGAAHHAFQGSVLPVYEQVAGYLTPPLLLTLLAAGVLGRDRLRRAPAVRSALVALTLAYPLSIPLLTSARGLVWAHRSWPFLYIVMSPVLAAGLLLLADGPLGRHARRIVSGSAVAAVLAAVCSVVLLVGNTAVEVNEAVQFPVPDVLGAQAGSTTAEELAMAQWFGLNAGPGARFVTDPMTAANVVLYGTGTYVADFPTWGLTEATGGTDPRMLSRLRDERVGWLLVDRRMYEQVPLDGVFYDGREPGANAHTAPVTAQAWQALLGRPWAQLVYETPQVAVFHLTPT